MTNPELTIEAMHTAARALRSPVVGPGETARALKSVIDSANAQLSLVLAEMDEVKAHEAEGASSITTWARRELGQDALVTRQQVRNAKSMRDLPDVAAAAAAGKLSHAHLNAFSFSLRHVGFEQTIDLEANLLTLAVLQSPREFMTKLRQLRAVEHPDELDEAWLKGMDKRDISLSRLPDGWHLTGFLDVETGAKFQTFLSNQSVPRDAGDTRTASQRRMDAFEELLDSVLEHGLPSDNGVRPHVNVTVDAQTLKSIYTGDKPVLDVTAEPIDLEGFGPVGRKFTEYLLCHAELTPILVTSVNGKPDVLDVGRTQRHATAKQATAIRHRQAGRCANPGCHHPIAHNHHVQWWSHGGRTALDTMVGLCRKCHTLVHTEKLHITGTHTTGFSFTTSQPQPLARTG